MKQHLLAWDVRKNLTAERFDFRFLCGEEDSNAVDVCVARREYLVLCCVLEIFRGSILGSFLELLSQLIMNANSELSGLAEPGEL
jgi:hypothetical protein